MIGNNMVNNRSMLCLVSALFLMLSVACASPGPESRESEKILPGSNITQILFEQVRVFIQSEHYPSCSYDRIHAVSVIEVQPPSMRNHRIFRAGEAWSEVLALDICGARHIHKVDLEMVDVGGHLAVSVKVNAEQ